MACDPTPEYLPDNTDLATRFLACDPVNHGTAGTVYRAFVGSHYYIVIDARRASSAQLTGITGKGRLVALRFPSRDARESVADRCTTERTSEDIMASCLGQWFRRERWSAAATGFAAAAAHKEDV